MTDHVDMGVFVNMPAAPRGPVPTIVGVPPKVDVRTMIMDTKSTENRGYCALVQFLAVYKVVDGDGGHVCFL